MGHDLWMASRTFDFTSVITTNHHCPLAKASLIIATLRGEDSNSERLDPARGSGLSLEVCRDAAVR